MADAQASGAAGGAATGTTSTDPLAWISQAMKNKLAALGPNVRTRAEAIYRQKVAQARTPRRRTIAKSPAKMREEAKARKEAIQKNTIYDKDGNETGQVGKGGEADKLMQESIAQAKAPPPRAKAKAKAVVGGRRRRTRRSRGRRRRTRRRRNKRKSKSRRRNRRK